MKMDHSGMNHMGMDHSGMDHSGMNHPGMNHGGDDDMCAMSMVFTWNYKNTCVVFNWWKIKTLHGLLLSCIAIALITGFYEYLKFYLYRKNRDSEAVVTSTSATNGSLNSPSPLTKRYAVSRSLWYGVQVGYSFLLMLVFMTYNGWLMLAVVVGAIWGHYHWGVKCTPEAGTLACH